MLVVTFRQTATRKPVILISTATHAEDKVGQSKKTNIRGQSKILCMLLVLLEMEAISDIRHMYNTVVVMNAVKSKAVGYLKASKTFNVPRSTLENYVNHPTKTIEGLVDGTPPRTIGATHPTGWIQLPIFTLWMKQFINFVRKTTEDPVVLILDGHYSHTIDVARESGVIIVWRSHV
ncbi:hypothetical protein J6590_081559 [Homalodisca vitripennis]|nr:hypothetical protein J6590_081559 [Homalodisca vitripennis]